MKSTHTHSCPTAPPARGQSPAFPVRLALFLAACILLTGACTRRSAATDQAPDVEVDIVELTPDPPAVGEAVLVVQITGADGSPLSGASVSLKADMTHAGMTPVFSDAVDQGDGRYRTTFRWTMAGDWILTINGTLQDGRTLHRELQLSVSADGG
jgi:hypothetical protein